MTLSVISSELLILSQPKSFELIGLLYLKSRSQHRVKTLLNVCWDNILMVKPFVVKLGMVMHGKEGGGGGGGNSH